MHSNMTDHESDNEAHSARKLISGMGGAQVAEKPEEKKSKVHPTHEHHKQEENINIRAAVVHVIGDMLQSIGVIIAAVLIYVWPEAKIADPICTYLFSILVIFTTIPVFRDCVRVLMESQPTGIDTAKLREQILAIKEVELIDDMHCWAIAGNKNVLTVHIKLFPEEHGDSSSRNQKVYNQVKTFINKLDICHFTAQIL